MSAFSFWARYSGSSQAQHITLTLCLSLIGAANLRLSPIPAPPILRPSAAHFGIKGYFKACRSSSFFKRVMDAPMQVNISSSDSSGDDSPRQIKRVSSPHADAAEVPTLLDTSPEGALFRKARTYQEYMKGISVPTKRGSVIPFTSWTGLGMSMKELYKQPFHYLTNIQLRQLDRMRLGAEDEDTPLDFIIHPLKAEASIWLMEENHRKTASPDHLAKLWLSDPMYDMYIDPVPRQ